eukprot:scaffold6436_cov113-Isochrysis_galbana.AAC.4
MALEVRRPRLIIGSAHQRASRLLLRQALRSWTGPVSRVVQRVAPLLRFSRGPLPREEQTAFESRTPPSAAACRYAFEILLEVKRILEGLPTLVDVPVRASTCRRACFAPPRLPRRLRPSHSTPITARPCPFRCPRAAT